MLSKKPNIAQEKTEKELDSKLSSIYKKKVEQGKKQQAAQMGVNFVKLVDQTIPTTALSLIDKIDAKKNGVIVYYKDREVIKLAALDPRSKQVINLATDLAKKFDIPVQIALTAQEGLDYALKQYKFIRQETHKDIINIDKKLIEKFSNEIKDFKEIGGKINQSSMSEFLNILFAAGLRVGASDIHLQPEEKSVVVRFRIDGVLQPIFNLESDKFTAVKKRIKLISKLKINIEDKPQDGVFSINLDKRKIDMRVSTLPSNFGESVVIRILDSQGIDLDFESLGFRKEVLDLFKKEIKKPNGMIIACGPTGSGKTTTLYSILNTLNSPEKKIITLEDPVEYKLSGITQTVIDQEKMDFATGLKAILRQDPDIVMVGEMRDLKTAETAINAALTGHLVISTIHTNDAVSAIPRFVAMGVKPFLLAPSINIIVGQRLVRRLCPKCKEKAQLKKEELIQIKKELKQLPGQYLENVDLNNLVFYKPVGCEKCGGLGMRGRMGIYEVLEITDEIRQSIHQEKISKVDIKNLAQKNGMLTMVQDGLLKALAGKTTPQEVFRVSS